jgi:hypothetical protein
MKPRKHIEGISNCTCKRCQQYRLTYALLVARNRGELLPEDFETGLLVISTYVSLTEIDLTDEAG